MAQFGHAWAYLATPTKNIKIILKLLMDTNYMHNINPITQTCPKILIISHFGIVWACLAMPNKNIKIILKLLLNNNFMQNINTITQPCPRYGILHAKNDFEFWECAFSFFENFVLVNSFCQATKRSTGRMTIKRLHDCVGKSNSS